MLSHLDIHSVGGFYQGSNYMRGHICYIKIGFREE